MLWVGLAHSTGGVFWWHGQSPHLPEQQLVLGL